MFRILKIAIPILLGCSGALHSQGIKQFSADTVKFPSEFAEYLERYLDEENTSLYNNFIEAWKSVGNSQEKRSRDVEILNLFLKKKARPNPHIFSYLATLEAFKNSTAGNEGFSQWEMAFVDLLTTKRTTLRTLLEVMEVTKGILSEGILYQSNAVKWKVTNPQFSITYDSRLRINFSSTDLICFAQRDSTMLYDTKGTLVIPDLIWEGESGQVTWERAGYERNQVFAELSSYKINMKTSGYKADSVLFHFSGYFDEPLLGSLEEKTKNIITPERATYPQFNSYQDRIKVDNLYENIDFEGGLAMQGARLNGSGDQNNKAKIYIYRGDTLVLKAASTFFVFRKEQVNSNRTEATLFIGEDSIYHPQIFFTFNIANRELSLLQTQDVLTKGPYKNSLHRVDMFVDHINWKIDEPVIKFTYPRGSSIGQAVFESANYYKESDFNWIQGMDEINPLDAVRRFADWYYSDVFPAEEFANWYRMPASQIRQLLIRLATMGFVSYNPERDEATIKEKLRTYLAAHSGKIDYDVMNIVSNTEAPQYNGLLDLKTSELSIYGVPQIFLSDSQNVVIYPNDNKIVLKENRNFNFKGRVEAGLFTFYGDDFSFDYDSFRIAMPSTDSIFIRIQTGEEDVYGGSFLADIRNLIQDVKGELRIDKPFNKSGRYSDPQYPIFRSLEESFVYYSGGGPGDSLASDAGSIRFKLEPFTIFNLDNFVKEDIAFKGEFESGGILPTIPQTLIVQEDYSLGFSHELPEEGLPVYDGRAIFYNEVAMSNVGLKGAGKLTYLTTTTWSEEFVFYPDSMATLASRFIMEKSEEGTQYPSVESSDIDIKWYPDRDEWIARNTDSPFDMYDGESKLSGEMILSTSTLTGDGASSLGEANITANQQLFLANAIKSDTARFDLKTNELANLAFLTDNLNTEINFTDRKGYFQSNDDFSRVDFPENQYISYLDYFVWNMSKDELVLARKETEANEPAPANTAILDERIQKISKYVSTHPRQDSLSFYSPSARYDTKNFIIYADEVSHLEIADAIIFPKDGEVTIEENARIRPLFGASVQVVTGNGRHDFYDGRIEITSKINYFGSGNYDYLPENASPQVIFFNDISVDTSMTTVASGVIEEKDSFLLSPYFMYMGDVDLNTTERLIKFTGGAQIIHDCPSLNLSYVAFSDKIDPMDVRIPVSIEPRSTGNSRLFQGTYISNDSIHIYPAFLSSRKFYSDAPINTASGYLSFDDLKGQYLITSQEKLTDPTLPDNLLALDRNFCQLYGEGRIDLGTDLGQLRVEPVGNVTYNIETDETMLNLMLGLDFFFSDEAVTLMGTEIRSLPTLEGIDINTENVKKSFSMLVGTEKRDRLYDEINLYGSYTTIPEELEQTLLITEVQLKWNPATNSYRSVGKIGVGNIGPIPVNVKLDGHFEIQKKRSGDLLDLYLEIDENTYYYFGYSRGVMQSISSNNEYRAALTSLNVNQRKLKVSSGETPYTYMIAVDRKMEMFLRRFRESDPGTIVGDSNDFSPR